MDVQAILSAKIEQLSPGDYSAGLRAVNLHISSAVRHLERGQKETDDALFTDAIYRCNQAFEGSLKEAYRVLASKDPSKKTPAQIEEFLTNGNVLRKKVLDLLVNYRREWRNPSTHDYMLDFDEDEALLAIGSVTVFAIVLCDQISSKVAFDITAQKQPGSVPDPAVPLLSLVAEKVLSFAREYNPADLTTDSVALNYLVFEGALAGHLSAEFAADNNTNVLQQEIILGREMDIVVQRASEKVLIEIKMSRSAAGSSAYNRLYIAQTAGYLASSNMSGALLLIYSKEASEYKCEAAESPLSDRMKVISAIHSKASK